MTKFKVGDKVRVRKDLKVGGRYGCVVATGRLMQYRGQIKTITQISSLFKNVFILDNNDRCFWSPEMLEPVKDDKLIFNGNATILFKDGKKYVTKCDTSDTYDREKGLLTVLAKANGYNYKAIQEMLKNATIKGEDMIVREVRRRAKVGEYVKIIKRMCSSDNDYRDGDILKIIDVDNYVRYGRDLGQFLFDTEYVVLANYKPKEKKENAKR